MSIRKPKIAWLRYTDVWEEVKEAARTTIHKEGSGKTPSDSWKKTILLAEHSPIRLIHVKWKWSDLLRWVSDHFVRHKFGIEHFVSTQRTDRTGINRDELKQSEPVSHQCDADAQSMINISRRRLCNQASPETREAWKATLEELRPKDPVLVSVCVPECIYRGFCPEFEPCGYVNTEDYKKRLEEYRNKNI